MPELTFPLPLPAGDHGPQPATFDARESRPDPGNSAVPFSPGADVPHDGRGPDREPRIVRRLASGPARPQEPAPRPSSRPGPLDLAVLPEFRALLPRLDLPTREQLLASIERFGFLSPLVAWWDSHARRFLILDGHERFDAWVRFYTTREDRRPGVVVVDLPHRAAARAWILLHASARRTTLPDPGKLALHALLAVTEPIA